MVKRSESNLIKNSIKTIANLTFKISLVELENSCSYSDYTTEINNPSAPGLQKSPALNAYQKPLKSKSSIGHGLLVFPGQRGRRHPGHCNPWPSLSGPRRVPWRGASGREPGSKPGGLT